MRKRITQLSLIVLVGLFAINLGGCATANQQTEVANFRFLVNEVDNLGDSLNRLFD